MNEKMKEAFDLVCASEKLKNDTKIYIEKKTQKNHSRLSFPYKKMVMAAVCFFFIFFGIKEYQAYYTPVALISVDVNPSFEIEINRYDKVINVISFNEDGENLVAEFDLKHMNYEKAINEVLNNKQILAYLSSDEMMSISLVDVSEKKREEMLLCLERQASKHQNVYCHEGNENLVKTAHESGFSFGKYQAYLELQEANPEIDIEDVREMSMKEIHDMIESCGKENAGHGNHHHYQRGS